MPTGQAAGCEKMGSGLFIDDGGLRGVVYC